MDSFHDFPVQEPLVCTGHLRPVVDISFSGLVQPEEFYFLDASIDGTAIFRRGNSIEWIGTYSHKGAVWSCKVSQDALLSITGSADFTACMWDNTNGKLLSEFPHDHVVKVVDVSKDKRYVLTAGLNQQIRLFDTNSNILVKEYHIQSPVYSSFLDSENG